MSSYLISSGRDEARSPSSGGSLDVDFDRPSNKHIAFASGFHRCLGSHLARLELVIALEEWHKRIPDYRIRSEDELLYFNYNVRTVAQLPLVFGRAR